MPTSKLPVDFVPVSGRLYNWAQQYPGVYCNLRPNQRARKEMERSLFYDDSVFVHKPVRRFLEALPPKSKVLMHFQGYGEKDLGTALVTIDKVFWTDEPYPRLDFKHPPELERIHGCPNFWGAFILLITAAHPSDEEWVREDEFGFIFLHAVEAMGMGTRPFYATEGEFTAEEREAAALLRALVNDPHRPMLQENLFLGATWVPDEAPHLSLTSGGLEAGKLKQATAKCEWETTGIPVEPTLEAARKFRLDPAALLQQLVKLSGLQGRLF